ncbi:MAG: type II secretion system inner membrane protein GspF [Pseudomonadota bacterium]
MGAYEYSALDTKGHTKKGVLAGDTARQVRQQLREQGLSPLSVDPVTEASGGFGVGRLSTSEQALLLRQLASLLGAGLPLEESLATVSQQSDRAGSKKIMTALRSRVMEGHALSSSMAEFPGAFPPLVRASIAAGEQSGQLDQVMNRLADYAESRDALGRKVLLAMLYPAIVAVVAVATMMGLLTYVVPQVVTVFNSMDQSLPWLTRALMALSGWLTQNIGWLLLAIVAAVVLVGLALRQPSLRQLWHRTLLRLPILGRLSRAANTARLCRTLSILTGSAVPLLDALKISADVLSNLTMAKATREVTRQVREGGSLSRSMQASAVFPPLVVRLIASGEKSGELDQMLERAAEHQDRQVESTVAVFTGVLEPVMILLIGGMVLTIVLAILLPIFQLNQLTGG